LPKNRYQKQKKKLLLAMLQKKRFTKKNWSFLPVIIENMQTLFHTFVYECLGQYFSKVTGLSKVWSLAPSMGQLPNSKLAIFSKNAPNWLQKHRQNTLFEKK